MNPMYDYALGKVRHNSNFNLAIIGPVGSGKSLAALRIATDLDAGFPKDASRVVFSVKDFYEAVQLRVDGKIPAGACIVLDEAAVDLSSGKHYTDESIQNMRSVLHTFRKFQLISILTFPISIGKLSSQVRDCFDVVLDMRDINFKEKYSVGVPHLVQINSYSGKDYRHTFKGVDNGEEVSMAALKIMLPPGELVEAYEKKQDSFKKNLLRTAIKFETKAAAKEKGMDVFYDQVLKEPKLYLARDGITFSPLIISGRLSLSSGKAKALSARLNSDLLHGKIKPFG